ncbi:MAG: response regulator [Pseudomonadota bacterium]
MFDLDTNPLNGSQAGAIGDRRLAGLFHRLPAAARWSAAPGGRVRLPERAPSPPRVLHVDRDRDVALVIATLLMPEAQVTHVYTLAEARLALSRGSFSLVVLDPDLPDGDGAALFETLKQADAPTPVLLYTARHTVWRDQASAFLLKPWTAPHQLWSTIERLLGTARGAAAHA